MSAITIIREIEKRVKLSFRVIKEEFTEHLDSINENTNEIQHNTEEILELTKKIDKLTQRLEELELMRLGQNIKKEQALPLFDSLTQMEREVFLTLYQNQKNPQTIQSISHRLTITDETVKKAIMNLITKGVPIIKRYNKHESTLSLDQAAMLSQNQENIMEIDTQLLAQ